MNSPSDGGRLQIPQIDAALLGSAMDVFRRWIGEVQYAEAGVELDEPDEAELDPAELLAIFGDELGVDRKTSTAALVRIFALTRLLALDPLLAALANRASQDELRHEALRAAAMLDLWIDEDGDIASANFDPQQFRTALAPA